MRSMTGMSFGASPHRPGVMSRAGRRRPLTGKVDLAGQAAPGAPRSLVGPVPRGVRPSPDAGPSVLIDGYRTPAAIRRMGTTRLTR